MGKMHFLALPGGLVSDRKPAWRETGLDVASEKSFPCCKTQTVGRAAGDFGH